MTAYVFTSAQKADIRRFCGYPAYGASGSGWTGYRFFQDNGMLEYRMNNLLPEEGAVVVNTYLTNLYILESAIPNAGTNLDTDQAAVWHHNKDEVRDRIALFDDWRRRLAGFLGIPPGPYLDSSGNSIQLLA